MRAAEPERILVIKLAALGDVVQAFPAFARIRSAHPQAHITLLTTPPYASLAEATPYFDAVETDGRPGGLATLAMLARLRRARYDRVYDLQTSTRSSAYFHALWPSSPQWSGIARGASHPHRNPDRDRMHTLERLAEQLKDAGIWPDAPIRRGCAPYPDLSFMLDKASATRIQARFGLVSPYALMVPGASAQRPRKLWPASNYAELGLQLASTGLRLGIVGGPSERQVASEMTSAMGSAAVDLAGRTDYAELAAIGAGARLVVGNDTGPTHLLAAAGAPTLVLFSADSEPSECAPRGRRVRVLQSPDLADLSPKSVIVTARALLAEGLLLPGEAGEGDRPQGGGGGSSPQPRL